MCAQKLTRRQLSLSQGTDGIKNGKINLKNKQISMKNSGTVLSAAYVSKRCRPFLPRDAMHKRGLCCHAVSVCLSVCPSRS